MIVSLDLPQRFWPGTLVRLLYVVAVVLTFPLQLYPVTLTVLSFFKGCVEGDEDDFDGSPAGSEGEETDGDEDADGDGDVDADGWRVDGGEGMPEKGGALEGRPVSDGQPSADCRGAGGAMSDMLLLDSDAPRPVTAEEREWHTNGATTTERNSAPTIAFKEPR